MRLIIGMTLLTAISFIIWMIFNEEIKNNSYFKNADLSVEGFIKAMCLVTFCLTLGDYMTLYESHGDSTVFTGEHATVTSEKTSASSAPTPLYTDGIFTGQGEGFVGPVTVEVAVVDARIHSVEVVTHTDDLPWFNRANDVIPNLIIERQHADVDVVAGATYSSNGIIDGVKAALDQSRED